MRKWPDAPFIRHLSWGNSEVLLVNNLEAAREVLQTHAYSFVKPSFFVKLVGEMMGTGLLFGVGEQHRQLRRITAGKRPVDWHWDFIRKKKISWLKE